MRRSTPGRAQKFELCTCLVSRIAFLHFPCGGVISPPTVSGRFSSVGCFLRARKVEPPSARRKAKHLHPAGCSHFLLQGELPVIFSSKSCSPLEEFQGGRAAQYQDWTREELSPPLSRSNFGLAPPVFTCIARKQCFCVRRMKLLPISFPRLFLPFFSSSQRDSSEWGSVVRLTHGGVL